MTAMTSSAASDTDRARNRTGCPPAVSRPRQPWSTSTPPLPLPPGRCTSSSTTGGRVWRITAMAVSTSGASPTIVTDWPSSAFTPDRNIRWSSTRTTSTGLRSGVFTGLLGGGLRGRVGPVRPVRSGCGRRQGERDLGALLEAADAGRAAVPLHPAEDGLPHAQPVLRDVVELEPVAVVADERLDAQGADLE